MTGLGFPLLPRWQCPAPTRSVGNPVETGSCAPASGCPVPLAQSGVPAASSPPSHCLIRIHLASRWRRATYPGMHPPKIADHCSRCSGHLVGKQQAKQFQHHVMYPPAGRKGGGGLQKCQREGRWLAWWDVRERKGWERWFQRGRSRAPQLPTPLCGDVQPRREVSAGGTLPAPIAHHGEALWLARISPS